MNDTNIQQHQPKPKQSLMELRNTDLVSRLLAATPPYLYNIPLTSNSYFFSEMLKSLVQAKAENARQSNIAQQQKRARKRSWTQARAEYCNQQELQKQEKYDMNFNDWLAKSSYDPKRNENRPLELTKPMKMAENLEEKTFLEKHENHQIPNLFPPMQQNDSNLMLPPPPPLWYPPLYPPPYGIDPLHFFIDLRVSGHIYDRKNKTETATEPEKEPSKETFKITKHSSAFSVPNPKISPMNLSRHPEARSTKFDVKSLGFEKNDNKTGTHYIMKNVQRIYKSINECKIEEDKEENDEDRAKRVKDLKALIGLELVVDYMEHTKPKISQNSESSSTDVESIDSPSVDVVMCNDELQQEIL